MKKDRKKLKGFTLIELITTIAIISILFVIGGTIITSIINKSKEESLAITKNNILTSARAYIKEQRDTITWTDDFYGYGDDEKKSYSCVPIEELINKGYLTQNIKKQISHNHVLIWKNSNNVITSEELDEKQICTLGKLIEIPTDNTNCKQTLVYNGTEQLLIKNINKNIEISESSDSTTQVNAGTYNIKVKPKKGFFWNNEAQTNEEITLKCKIDKATPILKIKPKGDTYKPGEKTTVNVNSNVAGNLTSIPSDTNYFESNTIANIKDEDINTYKEAISVKFTSNTSTEGTVKITLTPKDSNNYNETSTDFIITETNNEEIPIPTKETYCLANLYYNGENQTLTKEAEKGFTLYNNIAKETGTHTVTAELDYGYIWEDGSLEDKTFDCTINAKTYTIEYDENYDTGYQWSCDTSFTGTTLNSIHTYEITKNLTENGFTCTGRKFIGWNTKANGEGTSYSNKESVINLTNINNDTITLYAQWEPNIIKVKLYTNGGQITGSNTSYTLSNNNYVLIENSGSKDYSISYNYGQEFIDLPNYNNSNYLYITKKKYKAKSAEEWNTQTDGKGKSYNQSKSYNHTELCDAKTNDCELSLYVNWIGYYHINYNGNGNTGENFTNPKSCNDSNLCGLNRYTAGTTYDTTNNILKHAKIHEFDKNYTLPQNLFTKTGYSKNGWNTKANGTGTNYSNKATVKNLTTKTNSTVTLYAQWTPNNYTVTFDTNNCGTTSTTSTTVTYNSTYKLATLTPKPGYTFNGWYTAESGGTQITSSTKVSITANQKLYAQCRPNTITVHYNSNEAKLGNNRECTNCTLDTNHNILTDGKLYSQTFNYEDTDIDLINYNGTTFKITAPTNYHVERGLEWNTKANGTGTSYGQTASAGINANSLCDARTNDCEITLFLNKQINTISIYFNVNDATEMSNSTYEINNNLVKYKNTTGCPANTNDKKCDEDGYRMGTLRATTTSFNLLDATELGLTKTGYSISNQNEAWIKEDGTTISQLKYSDVNINNILCDASSSNCTVTLYANLTPNDYTVTFNANSCGTISTSTKTVTYNSTYGKLPTLTAYENKNFVGWYTSASGGTKITTKTTVTSTSNHILYAHCNQTSPSTVKVYYNSNGISFNNNNYKTDSNYNILKSNGEKFYNTYNYTATSIDLAKYTSSRFNIPLTGTGYHIESGKVWLDKSNNNAYGQTTNDNVDASDLCSDTNSDVCEVTLYLNKQINTITLYYSANNTTSIGHNDFTIDYNNNYLIKYKNSVSCTKCDENKYRIGTLKYTSTSMDLPNVTGTGSFNIERTGYHISSTSEAWKNKTKGKIISQTKYTNTNVNELLCNAANNNCTVTLAVNWTANTYKIKYYGNGNNGGSTSNSTCTYDSNCTIKNSGYTKTGYDFSGWAKTTTGSVKYESGDTVKNLTSENNDIINLYAKWNAKTYTVTLNANGCGTTSTTSKTVTYNSTYGTLPTLTKKGYTFNGWYTASSGGTKVTSNTTVTTASNHTLYAQCRKNKIQIMYNTNDGTLSENRSNSIYTEDSDGYVLKNGNRIIQTYEYGDTDIELKNYNYDKQIYIINDNGLVAYEGKEWNTKKDGSGTSYDHSNNVYDANDLCETINSGDCKVTLYVNWATKMWLCRNPIKTGKTYMRSKPTGNNSYPAHVILTNTPVRILYTSKKNSDYYWVELIPNYYNNVTFTSYSKSYIDKTGNLYRGYIFKGCLLPGKITENYYCTFSDCTG